VHWQLATLAAIVLAYAAVSRRLDGAPITAAMVFTAVGLLVAVDVLGLVDRDADGLVVKTLAQATLAVVLFSDASRIDLHALRGELGVPTRLLGIGCCR
jgi:NhaP-type Na+/H+ or K+/H+ antiporter